VTGNEIRQTFLRYFEARDHRVVASASLVPDRDPTLMFTNAGMVQFKRAFLGEEVRDYSRAASSQKCMRVSGKHNDLDDVGRSPRHHTFFEMLGNFSFGDYFKSEAIDFAWDLLTNGYGLDPDQLVVSLLQSDDESYAIWKEQIGISDQRLFRLGEKENFWQMGDTGPCGPCSEIHLITDREAFESGADPSQEGFHEVWNLVFMQFNQTVDGVRTPLPKPSVDTGMGLERLAMILQGGKSNYDTDLFTPLLDKTQSISGYRVGSDDEKDVSVRVVADHARACAFLIGDGVLPSNEGRGYVLRRVLRRAARHGVLLGVEEPFLFDVAHVVVDQMGEVYTELAERRAFIEDTIRREEERFLSTLRRGLSLLEDEVTKLRKEKRESLPGEVVFKLYDTYGFPVDLTEDILRGHELGFEREAFDDCMREQAERARAAWKGSGEEAPIELYGELARAGAVEFTGYDRLEETSRIRALIRKGSEVDAVQEGERVGVVVGKTPFYAESGGQIGDTGIVEGPDGTLEVEETRRPVDGLVVHYGRVTLGSLAKGEEATLAVDAPARVATMRNHSATHLMHAALKGVLGPQCMQAGSLVAPDRTRFDFTHDAPLSEAQILEVEDRVNEQILANVSSGIERKGYQEAIASGAVAIFEEKYADVVRVVRFGEFSTELCGGTHVSATGDIGSFRIVSQSAVGSGVRRLEAVTGMGVLEHGRRDARLLRSAAELVKAPPVDLPERLRKLLEREKQLERELETARTQLRRGASGDPLNAVREVAGVRVIATQVPDASARELRSMVDDLKARLGSGIVLLAAPRQGKVALALGVTDDLVDRHRAGELIREISAIVGGSGGGRADFAQAGGTDVAAVPQALDRLLELVSS
jgi:alanyl-tRNA synthetase